MPEMHLRQPGFTHSACGLFARNKEKTSIIYANRGYKLHLQE